MAAKKVHQINIRLTEEEYMLFKKKATKFTSMSDMMRTSVLLLNNEQAVNRYDQICNFIEICKSEEFQIQKIGANFNQVVRLLNTLAKQNGLEENFLTEKILPELEKFGIFQKEIRKNHRDFIKKWRRL